MLAKTTRKRHEKPLPERTRIWEIYGALAKTVKNDHLKVRLYGHHNYLHAFLVGDVAYQIGCYEYGEKIGHRAGIAGLTHNADRLLQQRRSLNERGQAERIIRQAITKLPPEEGNLLEKNILPLVNGITASRRDVPRGDVRKMIEGQLATEEYISGDYGHDRISLLDDSELVNSVIEAVFSHDGKNDEDDDPVLICLMDADRVVNCRPDGALRSAQFYHEYPVLDPILWDKDPTADYRNPKTVLKDMMMSSEEWAMKGTPVSVRTRLGRQLINDPEVGAPFFLKYRRVLKLTYKKWGLQPCPPELSPMPPEKPSAA